METTGDKKGLRQGRLLQRLAADRHLTLDEISRIFSITTQTARRDIQELDEKGHLRRVRGGAMTLDRVGEGALRDRRVANRAAKERIGACVAAEIPDGSSVFLDTGTTCEAIAHALLRCRDLRVVTYSLRIAAFLSEHTSFVLAVPGGFVRSVDGAIFHEATPGFLSGFRFDVAVLSVTGVDENGDLADDDPAEVRVVRAAMAQANSTLLAVDNSKFGSLGLVRMGNLSEVSCLVTDAAPPDSVLEILSQAGGRVIVAGEDAPD